MTTLLEQHIEAEFTKRGYSIIDDYAAIPCKNPAKAEILKVIPRSLVRALPLLLTPSPTAGKPEREALYQILSKDCQHEYNIDPQCPPPQNVPRCSVCYRMAESLMAWAARPGLTRHDVKGAVYNALPAALFDKGTAPPWFEDAVESLSRWLIPPVRSPEPTWCSHIEWVKGFWMFIGWAGQQVQVDDWKVCPECETPKPTGLRQERESMDSKMRAGEEHDQRIVDDLTRRLDLAHVDLNDCREARDRAQEDAAHKEMDAFNLSQRLDTVQQQLAECREAMEHAAQGGRGG